MEGNSRADAVTMSITTVNPLPIIPDILMGNIRFHIIYWPIMLMALGLPLPKKVYGHPWLLFNNVKMTSNRNIV